MVFIISLIVLRVVVEQLWGRDVSPLAVVLAGLGLGAGEW